MFTKLLVADFVAEYEAEDSGEEYADSGLDDVEHVHQRRNALNHFGIHSYHVLEADDDCLAILQDSDVGREGPGEKEDGDDVGHYHLEHAFTVAEQQVREYVCDYVPDVCDFAQQREGRVCQFT